MNGTNRGTAGAVRLRGYSWLLMTFWTVAVGATLTWELNDERDEARQIARGEARGAFHKDLLLRRWAAGHGGVYVPVTEQTQPNPYLAKVADRDIVSSSGQRLTLLDPDRMMRQVQEMGPQEYGLRGHLTSLNPIDPANSPDPWERQALKAFERGQTEVSAEVDIDGEPHLRLMRPLITEESCLKCHAEQEYEVGEIRGGISVSVPMASTWPRQRSGMIHRTIGYGTVWLLGLGVVLLTSHRLRRHVARHKRAEEALRANQIRARDTAAALPGVVYQFVLHKDGTYAFPYVSEGITAILGMTPEEARRDPTALFPGLLVDEDVDAIFQSIDESAEHLTTWQREMQARSLSGEIKWIRATSNPHRMGDGSVHFNGVFLDITDRKEAQRKLHQANEMLEQRVAQRTTELQKANRDLHQEVAGHKQAEQWLLESEERFRSYFELGLVGMAIISPEKDWMEVNDQLLKTLGYSEQELISKSWNELTQPDDVEADETQLNRVLAGVTQGYSMDKRFLRKDGQTVYTSLSLRCLRRADGTVDCLVTVIQDITQRKRAEEALQQSRAFLQTVIDAVQDATLVVDRDYRVVLANRAARRRTGGRDPVSACMACYRLFHGRAAPCAAEHGPCPLKQVIAAKTPVTVVQTQNDPEGNERIVEISAAPIFNEAGEVVQIVESSRDITQRKRAEEALRKSEQRFRSLVETSSDWIWEIDRNGVYTYTSPKVKELLGYEPDEILGKTPFDLMPPDEARRIGAFFRNLCDSGEPFARLENTNLHRRGHTVVLETSGVPILDAEGNLAGYRGIDRDITQRKQAEEQLRRIQWLLTKEVSREPSGDERDTVYEQVYDDLSRLNTSRLLLDSVGKDVLRDIASDFLDLLGTSAAVYEKNGDYALGLLASNWCRFLDRASRRSCNTDDDREALESGKRHCYEACWSKACKASIETGQPVDIECRGGIRLYAAPIRAGEEIVGSINVGYGDPPRDRGKLLQIAQRYRVDPDELLELAQSYESRPHFIIEIAKKRLLAAARLIGEITQRKRAEKKTRAAQQRVLELERREKRHVEVELKKVRDQLVRQTQLAAVGQVSASIAHELRSPLSVIRNAAFFLKHKATLKESKWREYLDIMEQETASADRIINDLVAMSRGKEPVKKPVPLDPIITEACSRLGAARQIGWHITCRPDPFVIDIDAAQWEQVLRNLFSNAIRAVGEAGNIAVEATRSDQHDQIVISNDGPAIPAEQRELVFEPLFTTKSQGTGLGLTICRQIVESHGGTIQAVDCQHGTAFRIRLPRNQGEIPGKTGRELEAKRVE